MTNTEILQLSRLSYFRLLDFGQLRPAGIYCSRNGCTAALVFSDKTATGIDPYTAVAAEPRSIESYHRPSSHYPFICGAYAWQSLHHDRPYRHFTLPEGPARAIRNVRPARQRERAIVTDAYIPKSFRRHAFVGFSTARLCLRHSNTSNITPSTKGWTASQRPEFTRHQRPTASETLFINITTYSSTVKIYAPIEKGVACPQFFPLVNFFLKVFFSLVEK